MKILCIIVLEYVKEYADILFNALIPSKEINLSLVIKKLLKLTKIQSIMWKNCLIKLDRIIKITLISIVSD